MLPHGNPDTTVSGFPWGVTGTLGALLLAAYLCAVVCRHLVLSCSVLLMTLSANAVQGFDASCWTRAATRYRLDPVELAAHACVESRLRPAARNVNADGSEDLSVMQINTRHLPRLASFGISRAALETDACLNIHVGAYLLADLKSRYGDSWEATGAYNAGCTTLKGPACRQARSRYAWRVYAAMQSLQRTGHC